MLGAVILGLGLLLFAVARDWLLRTFGTTVGDTSRVKLPTVITLTIGSPMAAGYALLMTGIYALVFGDRGHSQGALWSLFRMVFGLIVTLGFVVVGLMIFAWARHAGR